MRESGSNRCGATLSCLSTALYLAIALVTLAVSSSVVNAYTVPKVVAVLLGAGLVLPLLAYHVFKLETLPRSANPLLLCFAFQVAALVLATVFSASPPVSFWGADWRRMGFLTSVSMLIVALAVPFVVKGSAERWKGFLRLTVGIGLIAALYGILQTLHFDPVLPDYMRSRLIEQFGGTFRAPGPIGQPTYYASYLLFPLFCALALARYESSRVWKFFASSSSFLVLASILLTLTRGAALGAMPTSRAGLFSADFPLQSPTQAFLRRQSDVFVTKFNAGGTGFVYSTFLGGSSDDTGLAIQVDASGNAILTGGTESDDFPISNALQPALLGDVDAFLAKLNSTGAFLIYSTYLGGSRSDIAYGLALDASGAAVVTGGTGSVDFPVVNNNVPFSGGEDGFVTRFNPSGTNIVFSRYLGGSGADAGQGIALDASGNVYVAGRTDSADFPLVNAIQPVFGGAVDGFVAKLVPGVGLAYSTYLGGSSTDMVLAMTVDASGNAYLTGATSSNNFPTVNALQPSQGGGASDAFATKISPSGAFLAYSTYIGGRSTDIGNGIDIDASGNAYLTGGITGLGANDDAFVAKLNAAGSAYMYSLRVGGSLTDSGTGIAVDLAGNAYIVGYTQSENFPVTFGAAQPTSGGRLDAFVMKILP